MGWREKSEVARADSFKCHLRGTCSDAHVQIGIGMDCTYASLAAFLRATRGVLVGVYMFPNVMWSFRETLEEELWSGHEFILCACTIIPTRVFIINVREVSICAQGYLS